MKDNLHIELPEEVRIEDLSPLGVFADIFRFEVRDISVQNLIYFKKEHLTSSTKEAVLSLKKELDSKNLFLVKILKTIIMSEDSVENSIPENWYIVYVQKYPTIEPADLPF